MDLLNVGAAVTTHEFWTVLLAALDEIGRPGRFLSDNTFRVLHAVAPERRSTLVPSQALTGLYASGDIDRLPPALRAICHTSPEQRLVFAYTGLLGLVLYVNNHYSLLLVDLVGQQAYHYDSFAPANHARVAWQSARNLCLTGVLDPARADNPLGHCVSFVQETTSCGVFVLLALRNVETALNSPDLLMGRTREEVIHQALLDSGSEAAVNEMRVELTLRIRAAICVMHNAMADGPESPEQAAVLGPLCNRTALRAFMTRYTICPQLMLDTLADALPPGMQLSVHEGCADMPETALAREQVEMLRASGPLCLVQLVDRARSRVTTSMLLVRTEDSAHLFAPAGPASALPARLAEAVGAHLEQLASPLVSRQNTAVLPLMLLAWWKRVGVWDQLNGDLQRICDLVLSEIALLGGSVHAAGFTERMDWFTRRAVGIVMCEAYDRLQRADPDGPVRGELESHWTRISTTRIRLRVREQDELSRHRLLAEAVDEARAWADEHAPPRWLESGGVHEIRAMYLAIEQNPAAAKMKELLNRVVDAARRLTEATMDASLSMTIAAEFFSRMFATWPVLLVGPGPDAPHAVRTTAPGEPDWDAMLASELSCDPAAACGMRICPVLHYSPGLTVHDQSMCACIDILELHALEQPLRLDASTPLCRFGPDALTLDLLGGQSTDCTPYSAAISSVPVHRRGRPGFMQAPGNASRSRKASVTSVFIPVVNQS